MTNVFFMHGIHDHTLHGFIIHSRQMKLTVATARHPLRRSTTARYTIWTTRCESRPRECEVRRFGSRPCWIMHSTLPNPATPMTPPTLSTAPPTAVMGSTIKYMASYLRNRKRQDPLTMCWRTEEPTRRAEILIKLEKKSIHFYDGDLYEIFVDDHSHRYLINCPCSAKKKITGAFVGQRCSRNGVRGPLVIRKLGSTASSKVHHRLIWHIGLESLQTVRRMMFEQHRYIYTSD